MISSNLILQNTFLLVWLLITEVVSNDYCIVDETRRAQYCTWSCCGTGSSQYCCMANLSPSIITGIVFACVGFICFVVVLLLCWCKKYQLHRRQVTSLPTGQTVSYIHGQGNQVHSNGYTSTYPLAPGYGMIYPEGPPTYSSLTPQPKQPPPYSPPSGPLPPPPEYSPSQNPFAQAVTQGYKS